MPSWSRLPSIVLVVVVAVALLLTACGREGEARTEVPDERDERRAAADATGTSTGGGRQEAPADAYAAWVDALARQDAAAACALQAPELTIGLRYEAILAGRAELGDPCTAFEALLWEDPAFDSAIRSVAVTQETEEDALLEVRLASRDLTVRMVVHRARWRVSSTSERSEAGADAGPARWVDVWCSLDGSMAPEEIIGLMGEPSGEYTVADGGEPQLWWAQDQYDFRVYLDPTDPDDPVLELVADYDALGAADREQLSCPELRT